ncbi:MULTISPECIES: EamA family transporter [Acinetobacter]|uniref:EamA family transporter n=1 Tax=Acinetobacter TaxID=469 RepID=UPI000C4086D3|nr:EamA family transporter [Acinetobacter sp.]MBC68654.1 EamA family transporter [Acinetobacter sp.]MBT50151.1 EamA family transporter [Acinetobacter sp.]MEC8567613.1 EamA family transporter [Pseudomonadota bacterium]
MLLKDKLAAFAVVFIWGINFYFMKVGISEISPMMLGCLRYILVLLPALFFIRIPQVGWKWLLLYGLISNFSQFAFMFSAIATGMPTGLVALVVQSQAFFTVIIATFFLKENASWNQWLAIVIASFGLGLIALGQQHSHVPLIGLLLVLCSAFSWACGNIVVKRMGSVHPVGLVVWGNLLTPVWFLLLAVQNTGWQGVVADWNALTWKGFGAAAFLAYFATIVGYGLWIHLLTRYPAAKISPLSLWVPVISMIFAYLVLDEHLNSWQWLGSTVVMLGLMVHLLGQKIKISFASKKILHS